MVSLYHKGVVFITNLFACHLTVIIVKLFQRVAYRAVKLTHLLQTGHLLDGCILVLTRLIGLKIQLCQRTNFSFHLCLYRSRDTISYENIWKIRCAQGKKLPMLLWYAYCELAIDVLRQILNALYIVPSRSEHLTQSFYKIRSLTIPDLYHLSMTVKLIAVKPLILQLRVIPYTIYDYLDIPCLSMLRHTTMYCFQQVMKLHWYLETLPQSRAIYEFLIEEHFYQIS